MHNYGTAVIVNSRRVYKKKSIDENKEKGSMNERHREKDSKIQGKVLKVKNEGHFQEAYFHFYAPDFNILFSHLNRVMWGDKGKGNSLYKVKAKEMITKYFGIESHNKFHFSNHVTRISKLHADFCSTIFVVKYTLSV